MSKKQVIVMRTDLNMRKGKQIAQGSHASMLAILQGGHISNLSDIKSDHAYGEDVTQVYMIPLTHHIDTWLSTNFKKVTVQAPDEQTLFDVIEKAALANIPYALITDSGLTEFHGVPTNTCCAIGPADDDIINNITGTFKLL